MSILKPLATGAFVAALAAIPAIPSSRPARDPFQAKLSKDEQIRHALDRLTFGPRPGDVEQVKRLGLKKWLDAQLHPERIRESAGLEAKLAPLESLRMTPRETVQHYPPPQLIRAIAAGRQPMPDDPVLRASVERVIARYKSKNPDQPDGKTGDGDAELEPARPLASILNAAELKVARNGSLAQKREMLGSMDREKLEDMLIAMTPGQRKQLFLAASPEARRKIVLLNGPQQVVAYDLLESKMLSAIYGTRQLAEELDDFWFNHFNVYHDKGADRFLIPSYEREAIRPNVLGRFRDLLEATAKSPAMLFYLDNFQSVRPDLDAKAKGNRRKRGLNENYARELMELHTLGVNGGYTQQDVIAVARCFTGWTIEEPLKGGGFRYNDKVHDKGEKVVLGRVIPAGGGMEDGERVLDILALHPSTAQFVSRELAQRFVADNPPPALVDRMAKTFLARDGDIREVMKTMLASKEFWSQGAYRAKVKTPFEMVASSVRALGGEVDDAFALAAQVGQLGEPLYRKQEPTGYSNLNTDWVNSAALLGRLNFALALAQNKLPAVSVDVSRLPADPEGMARALLSRRVSSQTQAAIQKALDQQKQPTPALLAGLVIGSPDFQRR